MFSSSHLFRQKYVLRVLCEFFLRYHNSFGKTFFSFWIWSYKEHQTLILFNTNIFSLCPLQYNCHRRAEKRIGWRFDNCARVHFCFKGFRRMTMHTGGRGRWWCSVHQNALFAPFDHFLCHHCLLSSVLSHGNWTWPSSTTFCFSEQLNYFVIFSCVCTFIVECQEIWRLSNR